MAKDQCLQFELPPSNSRVGGLSARRLFACLYAVALLQGCTASMHLTASNALVFDENADKLPYSVNVCILPNTASQVFTGKEVDFGVTTVVESQIGMVLEENVRRAFVNTFREVTIQHDANSSDGEDLSVEISFDKLEYHMEKGAVNRNRTFLVALHGKVEAVNPERSFSVSGVGRTYCEGWKCYSGDDVFGKGKLGKATEMLLAASILHDTKAYGSRLEGHLSNALNAALRQAIVNLVGELATSIAQNSATGP